MAFVDRARGVLNETVESFTGLHEGEACADGLCHRHLAWQKWGD